MSPIEKKAGQKSKKNFHMSPGRKKAEQKSEKISYMSPSRKKQDIIARKHRTKSKTHQSGFAQTIPIPAVSKQTEFGGDCFGLGGLQLLRFPLRPQIAKSNKLTTTNLKPTPEQLQTAQTKSMSSPKFIATKPLISIPSPANPSP